MVPLNHDILLHIVEYLESADGYRSLFYCSLVNTAFNNAASKLLYRRVVLSPHLTLSFRLGRHDQELTNTWISARLPSNAGLVCELQISGYLVDRSSPFNNFSNVLYDSILAWENLHTVVFNPSVCPGDVFEHALKALKRCTRLRRLTVNHSCCDEGSTLLLVQLRDLESLTIESPPRSILSILPEWLSNISSTLRHFHLTDNCGSVTPGVLRSFLPHLAGIRSFTLGLSYSLTDDDVFAFLTELSSLAKLDFRYYLQLRAPTCRPDLPSLKALTIHHVPFTRRTDAHYLIKWIRGLSASSPLETIKLVVDPGYNRLTGPSISLDGLLDHISSKHCQTLRILHLPQDFVGLEALRNFARCCTELEELAVGTAAHILAPVGTALLATHETNLPAIQDTFCQVFSPLQRLHTLALYTPQTKVHRVHCDINTATLLVTSLPRLRRLTINKSRWEGSWVSSLSGRVCFTVQVLPVS